MNDTKTNNRYFADVRVDFRVYFDDDGGNDVSDQAIDALLLAVDLPNRDGECETFGISVITTEKVTL